MVLRGVGRSRGSALATGTAVLIVLVCLAVPAGAFAAPYNWSGGHDVVGSPEARRTFYFAEGTTRTGYEEYLLLRNPGSNEASVLVTYSFPPPGEPLSRFVTMPAGAGASICVNHVVGRGKDVSISVESTTDITAERQVYFNYMGIWTGGHATSGVTAPSDTWYFAEGTTRHGFREWLCLQNPGGEDVTATITYMLENGENAGESVLLGARSRTTVDVNRSVGAGRDVSLVVSASGPVVAERPMYFDYNRSYRGGHDVTGSTGLGREWYFAEGTTRNGFEEWLCILNPGDEAKARIWYLFSDGTPVVMERDLGARSRTTVFVNEAVGPEKDVSIRVEADGDILCERPMYFCYDSEMEGGHVARGSLSGELTWQFPTAAAGPGFEAWLCLMNPGGEYNKVTVELAGGGECRSREIPMGPYARATVDLRAASEGMRDPWVKVEGERPVVAERPVYFSYEPVVEPEPFTYAACGGTELKCPIRYSDLLGIVFHEAYPTGDDGKPNNPQVMQPMGTCMQNDNPYNLCPGISLSPGGDAAYFIESSRGRRTCSTSASDVVAKAGSPVFSPVSGTVAAAEGYLLYGRYYDLRVRILMDGRPGFHAVVLHLDTVNVSAGQRVEAGATRLGTVRDLAAHFNNAAGVYSREAGNHAHVQVNYRPDIYLGSAVFGGWMEIP